MNADKKAYLFPDQSQLVRLLHELKNKIVDGDCYNTTTTHKLKKVKGKGLIPHRIIINDNNGIINITYEEEDDPNFDINQFKTSFNMVVKPKSN